MPINVISDTCAISIQWGGVGLGYGFLVPTHHHVG